MPDLFPSAPGDYALRTGEVHVWKIALASRIATLGDLRCILSAAEIDRACRFRFEKDQARFVSCRASLRLLLSRYTGAPPEEIAFRYESGGKPALAGIAGWQFNVSHSRDLAAIAISHYDALGIDVEIIEPNFPRNDVAPDVLANDELADLAALPVSGQPAHFFQLWTLKEALLKAVGIGFSTEPRSIRIRMDELLNPVIVSAPPEFLHASLHRFSLEDGYASALAIMARVSNIAFFTLPQNAVPL